MATEYATRRVPQLQIEALAEAGAKGRLLVFDFADRRSDPSGGRLQTPRFYYPFGQEIPSH
jgi:hypothetical protein